jgi:hypothetical protein
MMSRHGEVDYARDVDRTKRRDAEFAEKNAGVIEKNSAFVSATFAALRFVDFIRCHRRPSNFRCVCPKRSRRFLLCFD